MPTPRENPILIRIWKAYCDLRLAKEASFKQVCAELSTMYRCSPSTVRYHIKPQHSESRAALVRRRHRHYQKEVTERPAWFLSLVFPNREETDLEIIAEGIRVMTEGTPFKTRTIQRILRAYETGQHEGRIRGPPYLSEVRRGVWSYTDNTAR